MLYASFWLVLWFSGFRFALGVGMGPGPHCKGLIPIRRMPLGFFLPINLASFFAPFVLALILLPEEIKPQPKPMFAILFGSVLMPRPLFRSNGIFLPESSRLLGFIREYIGADGQLVTFPALSFANEINYSNAGSDLKIKNQIGLILEKLYGTLRLNYVNSAHRMEIDKLRTEIVRPCAN